MNKPSEISDPAEMNRWLKEHGARVATLLGVGTTANMIHTARRARGDLRGRWRGRGGQGRGSRGRGHRREAEESRRSAQVAPVRTCRARFSWQVPLRCQRKQGHRGLHRAWSGETLVGWRIERKNDCVTFFSLIGEPALTPEQKATMVNA
jgi:hypothetical protein